MTTPVRNITATITARYWSGLYIENTSACEGKAGAAAAPPHNTHLSRYDGDIFVKGGTDHIGESHLRTTVQDTVQAPEDLGVGCGVVRFRVLFRVPQTDREHVRSTRGGGGDRFLEPWLLPQDREYFSVKNLRELAKRVRSQA